MPFMREEKSQQTNIWHCQMVVGAMEKNENGEKGYGIISIYIIPLYIIFEYKSHVNKTGSHAAIWGKSRGMGKG